MTNMRNSRELVLALQIFLFCLVVNNAGSLPVNPKHQSKLNSGPGLYNATDSVVILNKDTFNSTIYNSEQGWMVEFYVSWCGHCQRFAPIYSAFAKRVSEWKDIVNVAVIDCSNYQNVETCGDHNVTVYPTVKYFPIHTPLGESGVKYDRGHNVSSHTQILAAIVQQEQESGRAQHHWPDMKPYNHSSLENVWSNVSIDVNYQFLIFETVESPLGVETILDFHKTPGVKVRIVTSDNYELGLLTNVTVFPTLVILKRDHPSKFLDIELPSAERVAKVIDFLTFEGVDASTEKVIASTEEVQTVRPIESTTTKQIEDNDAVYQVDLANALYMSLNREIPLSRNIDGLKMAALKNYLKALVDFFPATDSNVKAFLREIKESVEPHDEMSGKDFRQLVQASQERHIPDFAGPWEWKGCQGSKAQYRGYPCGMWTMFHTLTVANREPIESLGNQPKSVLNAMRGYIRNFFGCADCAQHFLQMAEEKKLDGVDSFDDGILWLWRAHNQVNERLAGDETEDPEHKKIQYPSATHCPTCRSADSKWDEKEVLEYLKNKYTRIVPASKN